MKIKKSHSQNKFQEDVPARRTSRFRDMINRVQIFHDKPAELALLGITLCFISLCIILAWQLPYLPPQIPFWYLFTSEARLASKLVLWFVPGLIGILLIFNLVLAQFIYKREQALARLLLLSLLIVCFLSFIGVLKIISLVI